ncbi:hypothetical protein BH10BDE1_BH10BDE1_25410 [soil metagenome]
MTRKLVSKVLLPLTVFSALAMAAVFAEAAPATLPILGKNSSEVRAAGKTKTFECMVYPDRIVITRGFDGVTTTEERNFSIAGSLTAKIDDVLATKPQTKTTGPLEMSYSFFAFHSSAPGTQDTVILSSFNGTTGEDIYNPARGATMMRDMINTICGN